MATNTSQHDLIKVLMGEDELGAVIRAHLLVESELLRLFELLTPYPKHIDKLNLGYSKKVDLALALGLNSQYGPPLKKFGYIRNDFAHKPGAEITSKHVNDLYGAFSQRDRQVILDAFERTKKQIEGSRNVEFDLLEPKEKFVLIVVVLQSILLAANINLEKDRFNN
jgi:hypothetical protein